MAIVIDPTSEDTIDLDAFVEYVEGSVDIDSVDGLVEIAELFKSLGNNKSLVADALNKKIVSLLNDESDASYTPASLMLCNRKEFYVRANIWVPVRMGGVMNDRRQRIYSLEVPHNHNFRFITIGYSGSGYVTDLYRIKVADLKSIEGRIGEHVTLAKHKSLRLTRGRVVVFEPFTDIHTQHAPSDLSITLNLITRNVENSVKPQYLFDVEEETIVGMPEAIFCKRRRDFVRAAALLGNSNTHDLIEELSRQRIEGLSGYARHLVSNDFKDDRSEDRLYWF